MRRSWPDSQAAASQVAAWRDGIYRTSPRCAAGCRIASLGPPLHDTVLTQSVCTCCIPLAKTPVFRGPINGRHLAVASTYSVPRVLSACGELVRHVLFGLLLIWTVYALNPDGTFGMPLADFANDSACMNASFRIALFRGVENRCGEAGLSGVRS
jgi:hypothetical protein